MIYNGCRYLLRYGYLTATPHCEVCALESNDIHIEEHHVVRSRYLERTRLVARNNQEQINDRTEYQSFSDESSMIAGMTSDEEEDASHLAAPFQFPQIEIDVVGTPVESSESQAQSYNMMGSAQWEQPASVNLTRAREIYHRYRSMLNIASQCATVAESRRLQRSMSAATIARSKEPKGNDLPVEKDALISPMTEELCHRYVPASDLHSRCASEAEWRLLQRDETVDATAPVLQAARGEAISRNSSDIHNEAMNSPTTQESHRKYVSLPIRHKASEGESRRFPSTTHAEVAAADDEAAAAAADYDVAAADAAAVPGIVPVFAKPAATVITACGKELLGISSFDKESLDSQTVQKSCSTYAPTPARCGVPEVMSRQQLQRINSALARNHLLGNKSAVDNKDLGTCRNTTLASGSISPRIAGYVGEASFESITTARDLLSSENQLLVNQGNSVMAEILPSDLERRNKRNTSFRGSENIRAADLTDAVNIGLSLSEMIQSTLQSALEKAGYSVSASSPPHDRTLAKPGNSSTLASPPPTRTVHSPTFSSSPVGYEGSMTITNNAIAPRSTNLGTILPAATSQTFRTGLHLSLTDLEHSGPIGSTHSTGESAASRGTLALNNSKQCGTTTSKLSDNSPKHFGYITPNGTLPDAIHTRAFHVNAPHEIHDRLSGTEIPLDVHQPASMKPNAYNAFTGDISTTLSGSIQPGCSKARLPPNNMVVSRESQLPNASMKPDTNNFSAEWLMVSAQQRPLDKESFNPLVQRKAAKNNAPVRGRTTRGKVPRESGGESLCASSISSLKYHNWDGHGLVGLPSSRPEMAVNYSVGSNEQVMSEHLYARRKPMVADISKSNTQLGKPSQATQPNPYGSLRALNNESQELVVTPLARQLSTSGDSKSMANPRPSPPSGSIPGNTFRGFTSYSTTALTVPPRQNQTTRQMSTNRSEKVLTSATSLKRHQVNHLDASDEIVISPLIKKLHKSGNSVQISKPRTTSNGILAKVNVGRCPQVLERMESVITHTARPAPANTDTSAMLATDKVVVNLAPAETVANEPSHIDSAGALVPWSASPTRRFSVSHGINLRPDLPLPPFESIGGHLHSRGIKEHWGVPFMPLRDEGRREEDIEDIVEWLMLSSNNIEELPSPHPSLLSITSVDSGGPTDPGSTSIWSLRDSGHLICPGPLSITSGDSGRSSGPDPMSITHGDSVGSVGFTGLAPLPTTSGDSGGPTRQGPMSFMSQESASPEGPAPLWITSRNSVGPVGPVPQNNDISEQSNQRDIQTSVPNQISVLQNRVSKPRNRRKSTVPRKKRPKTLKQPTTIRGKVAKPLSPPSRKSIEHFIVVCEGEAFRVSSRVLEEASPVVRDFSKTCLQASSTGDCFFEVLGVTPWAMHELLKYICRTSYNRTLMRSSYMKNLAEKLKIKINSDGNPQT